MKKWILLAIAFTVVFSGCTKSSTSPSDVNASDVDQINQLTENEEADYFTFEDLSEGDSWGTGGGNTMEIDNAITPLRWGRIERRISTTRDVTIDSLTPDTARVAITRTVTGIFRILTDDSTVIDKPYRDIYRRNGVFVRTGRHTAYRHQNWRLVRVSGSEGQTDSTSTVVIASVSWYKKNCIRHRVATGRGSCNRSASLLADPGFDSAIRCERLLKGGSDIGIGWRLLRSVALSHPSWNSSSPATNDEYERDLFGYCSNTGFDGSIRTEHLYRSVDTGNLIR